MSEGAKKVGSRLLLLAAVGGGVSADQIIEWAFGAGDIHARVVSLEVKHNEHVLESNSRFAAQEAVALLNRQSIDGKFEKLNENFALLIRAVGRIEGKIDK